MATNWHLMTTEALLSAAAERGLLESQPSRDELIARLRKADGDNAPAEAKSPVSVRLRRTTLDAMTVAKLRQTAVNDFGIDVSNLNRKDELIDAIEAAQGKSEQTQAAEDGVPYDDGAPDEG